MRDEHAAAPGRPTAGRLAAQLIVQSAALIGQEVALARAEIASTARRASKGGILLAAAAVAAGSAWLAFLAAMILGLGVALPLWAAALIIGGLLAGGAGLLAAAAWRRLARIPPGLPLTAQSVRDDLGELRRSALEADGRAGADSRAGADGRAGAAGRAER